MPHLNRRVLVPAPVMEISTGAPWAIVNQEGGHPVYCLRTARVLPFLWTGNFWARFSLRPDFFLGLAACTTAFCCLECSRGARHRYQDATVRWGAHPLPISCNSLGFSGADNDLRAR